MHLTLRSHPVAQRPTQAAFLRGTDAGIWLREIGRWGLGAEQLSCYLVPESIRSVQPTGLLVVARPGTALPADVLEPYGVEAERLLLPIHATLWPAAAPDELRAALLWPWQFWHPALGLVGFDTTDELDLASLLDCAPPRPADWGRAQPTPARKASLRQLRVEVPSAEQVMQTMQQEVSTAPLADLPRPAAAQPTPARQLLDHIRRTVLQAGLAVVRRLQRWRLPSVPSWSKLLGTLLLATLGVLGLIWLVGAAANGAHIPWHTVAIVLVVLTLRLLGIGFDGDTDSQANYQPVRRPARPARPGLLQRLGTRLSGRLDELERKRNDEIERLLRLFGENPAEALKYAIPLGGLYQDRGSAPASASLGPRDTTFSLSGLGGGSRVDSWDLGRYQHDLRRQYQAAAEAELRAGHYQKAAYIHAHLLADYRAAAQALEQGGLFREAAALHKDHLHNPVAAAECLERGGLLLEAAALFAEQQQHEKAGDLYQQLTQPQLAARHYERGVEQLLTAHDHPEAARLLSAKLHAPARARQVLLQGWADHRQPETCLRQYFDVAAAAPGADLSAELQLIYQQHTPAERRVPLLRVLAAVHEQHPADDALLSTAREVAYEVVGAEAAAGRPEHLRLLQPFVPTDRLLAGDVSRYATAQQRRLTDAAPSLNVQAPQLDASIVWKHAVAIGRQWLALGVRDERLHLARANWQGHVEYYSWTTPLPPSLHLVLLADEQHSTRLVLRTSVPLPFDAKHLPRNKHFPQALRVECPSYLPPWPTRVAILPNEALATLQLLDNGTLDLKRYAADGTLLAPTFLPPLFDAPGGQPVDERASWPCELIYRQGTYYTYFDNWLVSLPGQGRVLKQELGPLQRVFQLTVSPYATELFFAATLDEELATWSPTTGPPQDQPRVYRADDYDGATDLLFVRPEYVVTFNPIDEDREVSARLYHLHAAGARLVETLPREPIAVLPTIDRQQFALLSHDGSCTLHTLPSA